MFQHSRATWQDPKMPVNGPAYIAARVDTVVIHYTAADDLIDGDPGEHASGFPAYLRAIQRDYVMSRGYSIGYNVAVDWLGGSWELRGTDYRCAANKGHNEHTFAILVLVDGNDMATEHAAATIRRIIGELERRRGSELVIVGHGQLRNPNAATACPGSGLRAQLALGEFSPRWDPQPEPPPPPPPTPDPPEAVRMFIIVGNADDRTDPRRWVWDGAVSMRLLGSEAEYHDLVNRAAVGLVALHPSFASLNDPFWMTTAERSLYGG